MRDTDIHAFAQRATMNTTHGDASRIARIVERGDKHLWCALNDFRCWYDLYDFVEKISDIVGGLVEVLAHPSVLSGTINDGEVKLVFGSVKREHKVEYHLIHLFRTTVRLIYLIHHDDRFESNLQSLLQHEPCLWHRTLKGIDEEQASVGHIKHTFHFASEVRVSRSVNNINLCTFPIYRDVF